MKSGSQEARAGLWLLFSMTAVAALAPCLAGERPLLVVAGGRIAMPALRSALHLLPLQDPAPEAAGPDASRPGGWRLSPPIAHDPLTIDLDSRLMPPGAAHWLGTDELGRDVLSRLIHATRPALLVALLATSLSLIVGIPVGAAAGYGGRNVDLLLSRLIEASLSFPALILLLLFTAVALREEAGITVGTAAGGDGAVSSLLVVGCAVGIARWGVIARYMRAEVLRLSRSDLATAARALGAAPARILTRHLIPAGLSPVVVSAAFGAGTAIVAEASLSFLGMGVQPPAPTWGQMIDSARLFGARYWWMLIFPGAMLALTVAAFNSLGEGLRKRGSA